MSNDRPEVQWIERSQNGESVWTMMSNDRPEVQGIESSFASGISCQLLGRTTAPKFRGLRELAVLICSFHDVSNDRPEVQGIESALLTHT